METTTVTSTPSAPPPSAPASSPAPSSPSSSTPASGTTSTGTTPSAKPVSTRELLSRKLEESKAAKEVKADPVAAPAGDTADKPVEKAAPKEDAPAPEAKAEGAPVQTPKEFEFPDLPSNIREALSAIPDKKLKEQIAGLAYAGKEFRTIRMTPAEGKELRAMYPSLEVARQAHQAAGAAYQLAQAYHSGTPEGIQHFIGNLSSANPQAFNALISHVVNELPRTNRDAFRKVRSDGVKDFIQHLRAKAEIAERNGDAARAHEFSTSALIAEEVAFPTGGGRGVSGPPQRPPNDPVVQQLQRLEAEKSAFLQQRQQASYQNVVTRVEADVTKEAEGLLNEADPDKLYPKKGREGILTRILDGVREQVRSNPHVGITLDGFLAQGNEQGASEFLLNQAQNHLDSVAAQVLKEYAEEFGVVQKSRQEKIAEVVSKKDVGGAPAALPKGPNQPVNTRGMTTKEKLEAMIASKSAR